MAEKRSPTPAKLFHGAPALASVRARPSRGRRPRHQRRTIGMTVVGRLTGGEGAGAYEVRTAGRRAGGPEVRNRPASRLRARRRTCDVLRARVAIPRRRRCVPGSSATPASPSSSCSPASRVRSPRRRTSNASIQLVELQRGAGISGATAVARRHRHECRPRAATGYCEHTGMRAYSAETRARCSIACARRRVRTRRRTCRRDDVVHMDSPHRTTCSWTATSHHGRDRLGGLRRAATRRSTSSRTPSTRSTSGSATTLLDAARARTDPGAAAVRRAHGAPADRLVDPAPRRRRGAWSIGIGTALLAAVGRSVGSDRDRGAAPHAVTSSPTASSSGCSPAASRA